MSTKGELILKNFGEHVARLRNSKDLSLRQLAEKCKLTHSQISKIESGQANITFHTIIELAEGLEVSLTQLFNFKY